MHMPQKRKQMNYIRLLLGIKGSTFLFNTAESPPSLHKGLCTFYGQDACAYKKEKQRDTMKITLNLACRLFLCIFGCGFVLFFSLPSSNRRKNPQLAWQLSLQRRILSQAINVHHYTA